MRFVLAFILFLSAHQSALASCEVCDGAGCWLCQSAGDGDPTPIAGDGVQTFALQGGQWPQPGGDGSPITLTYSYNNLLDGGLLDPSGIPVPAPFIRTVIEEALGLWAEVVPIEFVEVADEKGPVFTRGYPDGQFGQIRFHHRFINGPDPPNGNPTTKALAHFPNNGNNLGGDIHFDNSDPWAPIGTLREPDILGAAIHEIGHTLGLGHDTNPDANMHWIFTRTTGPGTGALHESDIAGVQSIYGAGVGSVTPLAIVPEPGAMLLLTIAALTVTARRR